jgi:sugar/nucleoside kinase (ribokinase family)
MSILAVGSVAFDAIKTKFGQVDKVLGGSATYFSLSASYFTDVRIVAVVGEDFTEEYESTFKKRSINTEGIQRSTGQSFFWSGEYGDNLNEAKTNFTHLNVFENFNPQIPPQYHDSDILFLGNIDPVLQAGVRKQMDGVRLVGGDTMNFWIYGKRSDLQETLKLIDVLLINDTEAKMLAQETSVPRAAKKVLAMGPKALVIKHGEYGATIFFREGAFGIHHGPFRAPTLPIEEVVDPTGAGDSFAGGFMGYIASQEEINRALKYLQAHWNRRYGLVDVR